MRPGKPVLKRISLRMDHDDRIGLLGTNGNGKSTFAKLLCGRLNPLSGQRRHHKQIKFGFFAQHQLDELDADKTPYDYVAALMQDKTEAQKRARLEQIGFPSHKAGTNCAKLSGGEKARMLFALATFHGPHLLILDEPTNHLDVDSRAALVMALNEYEGAVVLISHDRHLIEACADRLWIVRNGDVRAYDGDMASYRDECLAERGGTTRKKKRLLSSAESAGLSKKEQRKLAAEKRASLTPLRKNIQKFEKQMKQLAGQIKTLDSKLADNGLYERDPDKANELAIDRGKLARDLEKAEESWLEAEQIYEAATGG